ncbi:nitrilase-related carbon-nitrogen hydrolase [Texcoconibacillus texcoconensis]|uniref:Putative amidohydrolase n=1 Tax=Texcoconibacillus texcoconensis TaxID=1095777 RepID=A0A840QM73_9BACI|nr:nitrilase-related carbon-nitrogen hydrolase [Texcoconibacillus texcoconensis]MBB5172479.1 putative amidohydrolase [Texcoconibacillus texcoconensis]
MFHVAAIQMRSEMASVRENRVKAVKYVREAAENGARLIGLPELWVSGYHLQPEMFRAIAETAQGETVQLFQRLAQELHVVLVVPFPEREVDGADENIYVSVAVIDTDGRLCGVYRKSLLWGKEQRAFAAGGKHYPVFETALGNIGVLICYDIEFPEPARLLALQGAELVISPSVWSLQAEKRWDIQLPARALDNTYYVLGVNTVADGACGKSKLVDPRGEVLNEASPGEEEILYGVVDVDEIRKAREDVPYLDEYPHELTPGGSEKMREYIQGA